MAAIDEKIQATSFILHTPLTFDRLRALGQEAATAASGTLTKVKETAVDAGDLIKYTVQRAGFFDVLSFGIIFIEAEGDSLNTVILQPGHYITNQATVLFIPIGPKDSAGYPPLKKFSDYLRGALS